MHKPLSKQQIKAGVKSLHEDWTLATSSNSISRKYVFRNYMTGFMFVTKVSVHAEVALHHPEILLSYTSVKVTLSSKDIKALSKADFELARTCDNLYKLSTEKLPSAHNHY